jgi:hypothetical protein
METEIDNGQLFELFDRMINGDLNPSRTPDDDFSRIEKLLEVTRTFDDSQNKYIYESNYPSASYYLNNCVKEETEISFKDYSENPEKKRLVARDIICSPFPAPGNKADTYEMVLGIEEQVITHKIYSVLEKSKTLKKNKIFAWKNTKILRKLAKEYNDNLIKHRGNDPDIIDTYKFVFSCLKEYIIYFILFIEDVYYPLIDKSAKDFKKLRLELFNEKHVLYAASIVFPLIPKNEENKNLEREYVKLNKIYSNNRTLISYASVGKYLFENYKTKYKDLNAIDKINSYLREKHFWRELLITNRLKSIFLDDGENEPEIEKVLIPLLEEEIKMLEYLNEKPNTLKEIETVLIKAKKVDHINKKKSSKNIKSEEKTPFYENLIIQEPGVLSAFQRKQNQIKLAEICKNVFGAPKSPTIYALMFCILSEKKIINVLKGYYKPFFISWYNYIKADPPASFECIYKPIRNKFLDFTEIDNNKLDPKSNKDFADYLKKKNEFQNEQEKLVKANKLES